MIDLKNHSANYNGELSAGAGESDLVTGLFSPRSTTKGFYVLLIE